MVTALEPRPERGDPDDYQATLMAELLIGSCLALIGRQATLMAELLIGSCLALIGR
ncbi:hypothetical protein L2K20_11300 [Mycobacterium sp. MBM]|nr:hypothetical protein [Mycobacterium sp. MBM]